MLWKNFERKIQSEMDAIRGAITELRSAPNSHFIAEDSGIWWQAFDILGATGGSIQP